MYDNEFLANVGRDYSKTTTTTTTTTTPAALVSTCTLKHINF